MTDQTAWPAHLRDDAPSQQCGRCGRYTWSPSEFGTECRMPQPDGYPCGGRFEPPGILLDLYAARVGAPIPTDAVTPLPDGYAWAGKGHVRPTEIAPPQITADLLSPPMVGTPQLLIRWERRESGWLAPGIWREPVTMNTIIGHGSMPDGSLVRMVAHRTGRMEDELCHGKVTTTIDLHAVEPAGNTVTWYFVQAMPDAVAKWYFARGGHSEGGA